MTWVFLCSACRRGLDPQVTFLVRIGTQDLCARCWRAAGRPFPLRRATDAEIYAAEQAARERMKARGGADAYRVNAGKS